MQSDTPTFCIRLPRSANLKHNISTEKMLAEISILHLKQGFASAWTKTTIFPNTKLWQICLRENDFFPEKNIYIFVIALHSFGKNFSSNGWVRDVVLILCEILRGGSRLYHICPCFQAFCGCFFSQQVSSCRLLISKRSLSSEPVAGSALSSPRCEHRIASIRLLGETLHAVQFWLEP